MKGLLKKIVGATLGLSIMLASCMSGEVVFADGTKKVFIVGDSTACIYGKDDKYAIPRGGWGMFFQDFLSGDIEVVDLAMSGRSSKSFTVEEEYETLKKELREGDYLIIQFGHNDEKKNSDEDIEKRYTNPEGDKDTEGSFKNSLYTNYIKLAKEKGASPIIMTPVTRRSFDDEGKIKDNHGLYDDAIRELAAEVNIPMVDMTKITTDYYNEIGVEETKTLHAYFYDRSKGESGLDNTHFNQYGARLIAAMTAKGLFDTDSDLKNYVDTSKFNSENVINVTRGVFVDRLIRVLGIEGEAKTNFYDVDKSKTYYNSVGLAKEMGITEGNGEGAFKPSHYLTREDMMVFTAKVLDKNGLLEKADSSIVDKFDDANAVSDYAKQYLADMVKSGIITGTTDNKIHPDYFTTRQQVITVLTRIYNKLSSLENIDETNTQTLDELEKVENTK